jgi:glyoxylase-like metal-dependent hydrolase (beta-lactamase superfamily II)/rhodanese-related sulfurtransferase
MVGSIGIAELLERADAGEDLLLLDVRNEEEFAAWRLEGRKPVETVHVPYFDFIEDAESAAAKVPAGRDLVVLCAKGGSSAMIAELLGDAGRPARNVEGGMVAYGEHLQALRVPTGTRGGLEIWQLNRRGKGCLSYLLRSGGEAVVVDPSRRTEVYRELALRLGARIVRVLDTHVHADHLSGGPALAAAVGAPYSVDAGAGFELRRAVRPLEDGETIRFGESAIRVLASPGHTPGSVLLLAGERHLLSGDTLFVAGVGRPDLGGQAEAWGRALFATLRDRIGPLPDETVVLPAHFASVSEIGPDGIVSSRLGDLRGRAPEMQIRDERSFVGAMVASVSKPPAAYEHIVRANLGLESAPEEQMTEWELGKNQCAASASAAADRSRT